MSDTADFSPSDARRHYDRTAAKQDRQAWYEDVALRHLLAHGEFSKAHVVVEAGCGTGRFAEWLFSDALSAEAHFIGIDISSSMLHRAARRLAPFSRASLVQADATVAMPLRTASCDRFVVAYMFDLLAPEQSLALLGEAHRVLSPGGLLCLAGLTSAAPTALSRLVARALSAIRRRAPGRLGGCRPVSLAAQLDGRKWEIRDRTVVARFAVASEAIVALRR
ncbi:MAG: class I SAM-dependent methyltransferase [Pseudomonadota bacterium]|nr:class I SAM-dependent methyltransferase [Pseudomonadota bacterium]